MSFPNNEKLTNQTAYRSLWVSVFVNIVLAAVQMIAGVMAHSQALVSDGIHSLSDLLSDIVALFATRFSFQAADDKHPYGHRRYENAASLALGLLLAAGGVTMISAALNKFYTPESTPIHYAALWVALLALLTKECLFRYMLWQARKAQSGVLIANAWHARSDAASSLVALIGIIGAMAGFPLFDPLAALLVGAMVGSVGIKFAYQALQDLMDAAADEETIINIQKTVANVTGVIGFHDLRTRKTGDDVFVDIHIEVSADLSVVAGHNIAVDVRNSLLNMGNIADVMVHIDPVENHLQAT
ncbi:MAG: cation transporter [Neisseriaceae bacterium]|nr:cation transporter [Neisseriaceae bacterium]